MRVQDLINILQNCNGNDELTFIFDSNERFSTERGNGLFEVSQVNVTGLKINGRIALTNGNSHHLVEDDADSIFE